MTSPQQRVAIVTGGSGGIGRVTAERLARDGMYVAVHYAGNKARADEVVEAIAGKGGRAVAVGGDVADEDAMAAAFDAVELEFGGVDVVVHTAGLMILKPLAEFDLADLDRMHRTNIRGTFVVDQLAARRVRSGGAPSSTSPAPSSSWLCRPTRRTPHPRVPSTRSAWCWPRSWPAATSPSTRSPPARSRRRCSLTARATRSSTGWRR
jgi:NAD(P)-dependent dehydrogenase (short-subunit alcohol dehydrogenase family)